MLYKLLQWFGVTCRHRHLSHPFASMAIAAPKSTSQNWDAVGESSGHYVVCLDCGHKFQYDWSKMRVVWH